MGETMSSRVGALYALPLAAAVSAAAFSIPAQAAELPAIKISETNKVPACATPGRLTAFLEGRNGKLDKKFAVIAADYMRIGEELGIRWDTAFFQMLLETGNLTFTGDVDITQNNFAGLGATGKHESGDTFPDVPTGVKGHLQHLLLYSGEKIDNPVADRTRKVQEWGVLTEWLKSLKGPMTYQTLARKWAPSSRQYANNIENVQDAFYDGLCKSPDPKPEMMALAKPDTANKVAANTKTGKLGKKVDPAIHAEVQALAQVDETPAEAPPVAEAAEAAEATPPKVSGADLARKAVEEARASGSFVRSSLGGGSLAKAAATAPSAPEAAPEAAKVQPAVTIINAPKPEPQQVTVEAPPAAAAPAKAAGAEAAAKVEKVALGVGVKAAASVAPAAAQQAVTKCRVWTASYGGGHAVIIKANADLTTNYTVLDVNEGAEKREAEAYIAAYAKGGQPVGEFQSQTQALDKAFELCPEG
jgi:Mannosyl-glycoprotein endo-beta-N-acetylglucosaminidase